MRRTKRQIISCADPDRLIEIGTCTACGFATYAWSKKNRERYCPNCNKRYLACSWCIKTTPVVAYLFTEECLCPECSKKYTREQAKVFFQIENIHDWVAYEFRDGCHVRRGYND